MPNLSFGGPVLASLDKALRRDGRRCEFVLDCHLMVTNPEMYVEDFRKAGADMFTFHHEAASRPEGTFMCIVSLYIHVHARMLARAHIRHTHRSDIISLHVMCVYVPVTMMVMQVQGRQLWHAW